MKPLRIRMEAFGPYAGQQDIDFSQLKSHKLFLIHGNTGGGKTTIFDAMCVALYGETSGGRKAAHMRSMQASPEQICKLVFDFEVNAATYRIERTPEQTRRSQRGEKEVLQREKTALYRMDANEPELLASRVKEVAAQVEQILGLSMEQFCQVVLLPQGKFESVLKAKTSEREQVLEVLFRTEHYRLIEEKLREEAKLAEEAVSQLLCDKNAILVTGDVETPEALQEKRTETFAALAHQTDLRKSAAAADEAANLRLKQGEDVQRRLETLAQAEAQLASLESRRAQVEASRQTLDQAKKAASLADTERMAFERREELREAQQSFESARVSAASADTLKTQADLALEQETSRAPQREALRDKLARQRSLEPKVQALGRLAATCKQAEERLAASQARQQAATTQREELSTSLEKARKEKTDTEIQAASLAETAEILKSKRLLLANRTRLKAEELSLTKAQRSHTKAEAERAKADSAYSEARTACQKARERWIHGQAAELAATLEEGKPCPVCGSLEHPHAARRSSSSVTPEELEALEEQLSEAEAAREAALKAEQETVKALTQSKTSVDRLREALGEEADADPRQIETEVAQLEARLKTAQAAAKKLQTAAARFESLEQSLASAQQGIDAAAREAQEATTVCAEARAQLKAAEQELPAELNTPEKLSRAIRQNAQALKQLEESLASAQERAKTAAESLQHARATEKAKAEQLEKTRGAAEAAEKEFSQRLQAAGFADAAHYGAAKRRQAEMDALQKQIENYDASLIKASHELHQARQGAQDLAPANLEALRQECEATRQAIKDIDTRTGQLKAELQQTDELLARLARLREQMSDQEERAACLRRLRQYGCGEVGENNPGFHRYVLAALLDEVLLAANRRLRVMTSDRYQLLRRTDSEDRRQKMGLDLAVLDSCSGMRPVDTLSGGESFQAALSLALGLADVVQQHAGGIRLDTVFVDEGFGSLDPDALDKAMEALVNLQAEGRLVGIISHVSELRERIRDARLEVTSERGKSSARFFVS